MTDTSQDCLHGENPFLCVHCENHALSEENAGLLEDVRDLHDRCIALNSQVEFFREKLRLMTENRDRLQAQVDKSAAQIRDLNDIVDTMKTLTMFKKQAE